MPMTQISRMNLTWIGTVGGRTAHIQPGVSGCEGSIAGARRNTLGNPVSEEIDELAVSSLRITVVKWIYRASAIILLIQDLDIESFARERGLTRIPVVGIYGGGLRDTF